MTITEFLSARLDEVEATAKCALMWQQEHHHAIFVAHYGAEWGAIDDYDPARVLREVEADRAILAIADDADSLDLLVTQDRGLMTDPPHELAGERIRKALAAVYRDQPDYDEDWKP